VGLPIVSDRCSAVSSAAGAGFGRWLKWGIDLTGKIGYPGACHDEAENILG
jgi:hypothetical protein